MPPEHDDERCRPAIQEPFELVDVIVQNTDEAATRAIFKPTDFEGLHVVVKLGAHAVLHALREVAPGHRTEVAKEALQNPHHHVDGGQNEELVPPIDDAELGGDKAAFAPHHHVNDRANEDLGSDIHHLAERGIGGGLHH